MKEQAIALCRVSTPEQKLSNSLNRQEESVLKAADELGIEIVKWWSGDISSKAGTNVKRKDLKEMQEFCKQNKRIKYLVVDEPDRFMRSVDEAFYFEVVFRQLNVTVWYASDPNLNTGDLMSKMLKFSKLLPAEGSNVERQTKSILGHEKAIRDGRYTFPPKPGYTKGTEPGVHVPHPITFSPLQKAYKEVVSGLYTPLEAMKRLNASDFNKVHAHWNMDKFRHFGADSYYAGILVVDRQVKARNENGLHQQMLTREEHEKLVQIFNGTYKARGAKKQYNPEFPMNKIMACEDCGGEVKFTGARGHNGFYRESKAGRKPRTTINYYWKYRCRGCGKAYQRDEVHRLLTERLEDIKYTGNQQEEFTEALEIVWRQRQQDKLQEVKTLQRCLNDLEETKSKLVVEMATTDPSLKDDLRVEVNKTKAKITDIEQKISQLNELDQDLVQFVDFGLQYTNDLIEDWWDLGHDDRVWCQLLVFPGGIMFNSHKKVSTPQISPLYTLKPIKKDLRSDRKSLLVELVGTAPTSD